MRTLSFLFFTFLFIQVATGFSVILKSGKTVKGTLIGQDATSIQMKDTAGLVLSFKKSMLDLHAMQVLNTERQLDVKPLPVEREIPKSIVEIAQETKKSRTGFAHVLTNQDLANAPEITILGSGEEPLTDIQPAESSLPSKEEKYWREISNDLRKDVSVIREKRTAAEASCRRARDRQAEKRATPHRPDVDFFSLYEDPPECRKLHEIDRQLQEAQLRIENLEDRARRAGIPWQWLE